MYLRDCSLRYRFLSTCNETIFFRVQETAWGYELQHTGVVRHEYSVASDGSPSVRQYMFFLGLQAHVAHTTVINVPPINLRQRLILSRRSDKFNINDAFGDML
ncbi:hypothetical protein P170DRAFT_481251 [Aspergillus steynii IBT 23096]|uniref:Uncharacterized protein n=1 Tax=Aspergillus steynii IBT 23096 TaxID=1392250 RepID=A0A2I2FRQ1_9EURO|nr:uncharacterized protein P170DRAFT_481251 [Aspergillus steynii IBT 23096]PLB43303.1 hypothetical protein P170DRAFT_481251 [Aspergillus steynii IBT 23096]